MICVVNIVSIINTGSIIGLISGDLYSKFRVYPMNSFKVNVWEVWSIGWQLRIDAENNTKRFYVNRSAVYISWKSNERFRLNRPIRCQLWIRLKKALVHDDQTGFSICEDPVNSFLVVISKVWQMDRQMDGRTEKAKPIWIPSEKVRHNNICFCRITVAPHSM